jgi:hypothetical protein
MRLHWLLRLKILVSSSMRKSFSFFDVLLNILSIRTMGSISGVIINRLRKFCVSLWAHSRSSTRTWTQSVYIVWNPLLACYS